MKCTNCGKNNAVYHYHIEENGRVTEAHLCAECARELQPERQLAAMTRDMFGGLEDVFGGMGSMFGRRSGGLLGSFFEPFEGFFSPFASLAAPEIGFGAPETGDDRRDAQNSEPAGTDPELAKKRQANALRERMRAAAQAEDYETAAQLRDQLRKLEGGAQDR